MLTKYFSGSFLVAILGLTGAFAIGGLPTVWIVAVLGILEVSLSFDNAVVNAQVLKDMDEKWRKRFVTWGMLIAVFGMRMVFPLLIVSVALGINPVAALTIAVSDPAQYQHILESVHTSVMGFGQSFLMMVALKFFIDNDKEIHWLGVIENKLTFLGKIEAIQVAIALVITVITSAAIKHYAGFEEASAFLIASIWGLIVFVAVDSLEVLMSDDEVDSVTLTTTIAKSGLASFIYLEILDASFSFDGVLGALALSNNLFIIAIGLGIGAMFVRSLTLLMVDKGTVDEFIYLEHGAFYAILGLTVIMNVNTVYEIPETITGLIGAAFIGASLISSIKFNKREAAEAELAKSTL